MRRFLGAIIERIYTSVGDPTSPGNAVRRSSDAMKEIAMDSMTTYAACARIQTEYIEMPDLKLTPAQVRRLCGLRPEVCDAAVRVLVASGFLRQSANGALLRRSHHLDSSAPAL